MGDKKLKTEDILNEREKTHGDFDRVANLYNALKMEVTWSLDDKVGEHKITYKHILPIDMILLKLARIICGDPNHADHWDDIAGYAMLGKGEKNGVTSVSGKCGEIAEDRYAEGWNDGCDSAQAIYSKMKEENEQLKERNKQLELDVMRAHNKGVDAASEYYESTLDYLKNRWFNVEKCLPITGKKLTISYKGKIMENVRMRIYSDYQPHFIHCEDGAETALCKDMIAGWVYSDESMQNILIEAITKNSRLKDVEELKVKYSELGPLDWKFF